VQEVLRHFQGEIIDFEQVLQAASSGQFKAVYVAAGYPPRPDWWITEDQAQSLAKGGLLILQDLLPSPASEHAQFLLPSAAWAEKDGTLINYAGLAQAIRWSVTPPAESRPDGQVFLDLVERRGLIHAPTIRAELAKEVPYFAALEQGDLGEHGIQLAKIEK
jgi:predicted molibdopterin-dependent oxidoreductase YjgC